MFVKCMLLGRVDCEAVSWSVVCCVCYCLDALNLISWERQCSFLFTACLPCPSAVVIEMQALYIAAENNFISGNRGRIEGLSC